MHNSINFPLGNRCRTPSSATQRLERGAFGSCRSLGIFSAYEGIAGDSIARITGRITTEITGGMTVGITARITAGTAGGKTGGNTGEITGETTLHYRDYWRYC